MIALKEHNVSHRLFGSAFCTWLLIICFLASCSAPPVNNSVKVLPADPNAAYDVNAARTPIEPSQKSSSITLLKDHKLQAISKTSAMEQYRKTHPETKGPIKFKQSGDFSIQAASTPGNCYVGPVATGTASGEIVGTVYRENDNGLYIYQGPSTYGPNLLDVGRLYYDGVTSTISFNWRYYTGGPAAYVSATVSVPGRLEVGKSYSASFISGGIGWPAGSSNLEAGTVTINVTEDKITASITAQSVYYRYQVYYYTPFFTNYGTANNVTGTADIYTAPCAPTIDLEASPTLITSEETSEITVTPENNDFEWTLNITGPEEYNQSHPDVGLSEGEYSLAGTLPAGDYFLKAYYNAYPEYLAMEKVRIQPDISLEIAPAYINPRDPDSSLNKAKITVKPSDDNSEWEMVITDPNTNSSKGEPQKGTQTIYLEGTDLIDGIYGIQVAYVKFPDVMASDTVTVEFKNIEPTPTPTPTPTIGIPTPGPTVTPTPGPTVTPAPDDCEDAPIVNPTDINQLIDGLNGGFLQPISNTQQNFSTQSNGDFKIQKDNDKKSHTTHQQLLENLALYEQLFNQFVRSNPLLKADEILNKPAPTSYDDYRNQIIELIDQIKENNEPNHAELIVAANKLAELRQVFIHLAKDNLNNRFLFSELNSNWAIEVNQYYDHDVINVMSNIHNRVHLLNYIEKQLEHLGKQISTTQHHLEKELKSLFKNLGIAPEQFTLTYYNNIKQQADNALRTAQDGGTEFEKLLNTNEFSVKATNAKDLARQAYDAVKTSLVEYATATPEYAKQKALALTKAIKKGRDTVAKNAPELLVEWDQFITPVENYMMLAPIAKTNQTIRNSIIGLVCSAKDRPYAEGPPVGSGKFKVIASCGMRADLKNPGQVDCSNKTVTGIGYAKTPGQARKNSQKSANKVVPAGCVAKHCGYK